MWTRIKLLWPGQTARRRLGLAGFAAGLLVLAFCFGRWGAAPEVKAQQGPAAPGRLPVQQAAVSGDLSRQPVAYIFNSIPITREELGEYLIARFGQERIEFLVNRRIIEHACQLKGITVSDADVEAELVQDLQNMKITLDQFITQVLRRFNKTLYEYKEDVIRPKLALTKFCRDRVSVTQEDLLKGFEAHYGPKVECRMIVLQPELSKAQKDEVWTKVRDSADMFDKYAREQFIRDLASVGGRVPPIHKHFGDPRIEQVAFRLKPGEVSESFEMPDRTFVILKCEKHLPADNTHRLEDERLKLHKEIYDIKLAQEIPKVFQMLRSQASVEIFLRKDPAQEAMEQRRTNELLMKAAGAPQVGGPGQQQPGAVVRQQPPAGMQQPAGGVQQPPQTVRPPSGGAAEVFPPLGN